MNILQKDIIITIPKESMNYDTETQNSIFEYLNQLSEKEKVAYNIAKDHLGTSFNILKSIGYVSWKKSQNK